MAGMGAPSAKTMSALPAQDTESLLALVTDAQDKLSQLDFTAKGLLDELAASGAQGTPRLRELLATGDRLVAEVQAAGAQMAPRLPAGAALPAAPSRATVEAVWAFNVAPQQEQAVQPTPVSQPSSSLQELAASLQALPGCRLQLLQGRQPASQPDEATGVLLRCGRALAAVVHLQQPGRLLPLRVGILSAAEADAALLAGSSDASSSSGNGGSGGGSGGGSVSLWSPSEHAVFQQLSAQAGAALEHFLQRQQGQQGQVGGAGGSGLELLLLWLACCGDLFSPRSGGSGGLLLADAAAAGGGQVLTLRRPWQRSWEQLWAAALNPHLRTAEPAAG